MAAGKARVHELAKELGVTSKELLAKLKEQGESVKSASSTVERPVAQRLREAFGNRRPADRQGRHTNAGQVSGAPQGKRTSVEKQPRRPHLTGAQIARIRNEYRKASAAPNRDQAINKLYAKCGALYGISPPTLRDLIAGGRQEPQTTGTRVVSEDRHRNQQHQQHPGHSGTTQPPGRPTRGRIQLAGLPPVTAGIELEAIADLIVNHDPSRRRDRDTITADLQPFDPAGPDGYGYLGWRYATAYRPTEADRIREPGDDLAAIGHTVDAEKRLIDHVLEAHSGLLDHPIHARPALETKFRDLWDPEDDGRSSDDELRRVKDKDTFLRHAVILTIAAPDLADRLWALLDDLRPPKQSQLIEATPQLITRINNLNNHVSALEALLSADDTALNQFLHRSRVELIALHSGRFDHLTKFAGARAQPSRFPGQEIHGLSFRVLPPGEQIHTFIARLRAAGTYRGYQLDYSRLNVIETLHEHFGADRCALHLGDEASSGVDDQYWVLTIRASNGSGENAVAVSPVAGKHATFVVRHECSEPHWRTIFANPKSEATALGAIPLRFTPSNHHADKYTAISDRIIARLECDPNDFRKPLVYDEHSSRYRIVRGHDEHPQTTA